MAILLNFGPNYIFPTTSESVVSHHIFAESKPSMLFFQVYHHTSTPSPHGLRNLWTAPCASCASALCVFQSNLCQIIFNWEIWHISAADCNLHVICSKQAVRQIWQQQKTDLSVTVGKEYTHTFKTPLIQNNCIHKIYNNLIRNLWTIVQSDSNYYERVRGNNWWDNNWGNGFWHSYWYSSYCTPWVE